MQNTQRTQIQQGNKNLIKKKKWVKDHNRYLTKEDIHIKKDIHMAKKNMKRCTTSYIRKMQIETK